MVDPGRVRTIFITFSSVNQRTVTGTRIGRMRQCVPAGNHGAVHPAERAARRSEVDVGEQEEQQRHRDEVVQKGDGQQAVEAEQLIGAMPGKGRRGRYRSEPASGRTSPRRR